MKAVNASRAAGQVAGLCHEAVSRCCCWREFMEQLADTPARYMGNVIVRCSWTANIRGMRRLVCMFLIFLCLIQSSWAAGHASVEMTSVGVGASVTANNTLTHEDQETTTECTAQMHCCHPHSVGLVGAVDVVHIAVIGSGTPRHVSFWPADISFNDIERPKWLTASLAAAVL